MIDEEKEPTDWRFCLSPSHGQDKDLVLSYEVMYFQVNRLKAPARKQFSRRFNGYARKDCRPMQYQVQDKVIAALNRKDPNVRWLQRSLWEDHWNRLLAWNCRQIVWATSLPDDKRKKDPHLLKSEAECAYLEELTPIYVRMAQRDQG